MKGPFRGTRMTRAQPGAAQNSHSGHTQPPQISSPSTERLLKSYCRECHRPIKKLLESAPKKKRGRPYTKNGCIQTTEKNHVLISIQCAGWARYYSNLGDTMLQMLGLDWPKLQKPSGHTGGASKTMRTSSQKRLNKLQLTQPWTQPCIGFVTCAEVLDALYVFGLT